MPWRGEPGFAAALEAFWRLSRRTLKNQDESRALDGHAHLLGDGFRCIEWQPVSG